MEKAPYQGSNDNDVIAGLHADLSAMRDRKEKQRGEGKEEADEG